jgi:ubiquinone biosynthesis protein
MLEYILGFLVLIGAVVVVRRLVGIDRGRWVTTLAAVIVAQVAVTEIVSLVYGSVTDVPIRAVVGVYALVTIFAVLGILLVELVARRERRRRSALRVPHPIRATRAMARRALRYISVSRIWVHRGLVHADHDGEIAGSRLGRSLRRSFEDAGGLFIKLGQAMAQQPQLVTVPVAAELAQLQEAAAPANLDAARAVITADLGAPEEVFAEFDSTPLGSASIAQTYPARLHDGREVVVKVQRPGVAESIEGDLDILRRLANRFDRRTTWARSIGLKELVAGFEERVREELDFRIESANQTAAGKQMSSADLVVVPDVIEGMTSRRVLVEERAPGRSVGSDGVFMGWQENHRRALADALTALMLRQMLSGESFHADPHPGNVFLRPDGRLELLDFGAVGRLDAYERAAFLDVLRGVQAQDPVPVREGLLRIGTPVGSIDEEALDRELARLLSASRGADGHIDPSMFQDLLFVVRDFRLVLPRSTTTLLRTFTTLLGSLEVISPGYRVAEGAQRVGTDLLAEQVPHDLRELVKRGAVKHGYIIERLPREVDALLRVLRRGDFRARVRLLSEDEDVRWATGMLNRAIMAVVASALSLLSAILLAAGSAPTLQGVRVVNLLGGIGLFFGVLLLLRVVIEIVRDEG